MNTQENRNLNPNNQRPDEQFFSDRSGRVMGGFLLVMVGAVLLVSRMGVDLPSWITSWPMVPIVGGLYFGARHRFQGWGWVIPIGVGVFFLTGSFIHGLVLERLFWPVVIISVGLFMMFKSQLKTSRKKRREINRSVSLNPAEAQTETTDAQPLDTGDDATELITIFGGTKKVVISKNFQGGEAVTFFGGVELNLTQADIHGKVHLELIQVFSGAKLVVPSNWRIQTEEMVCIFGGVDDKRKADTLSHTSEKVLVLKGLCLFGGIDIKSY